MMLNWKRLIAIVSVIVVVLIIRSAVSYEVTTRDNTPTFKWNKATDLSAPVTYTLKVDDNSDLNSPVITENVVDRESYENENNQLSEGLYYWQVKAKDNKGGEKTWPIWTFRVTSTAENNPVEPPNTIFADILGIIAVIVLFVLLCSPAYDIFMHRKKQEVLYPELKQRALEVAKKKKGIVVKGELGKMPSKWYGWFVKKLEADGLAVKDPRDKDQILFPDIIAETHTDDEIMEMELPMGIGSKILKMREDKGKKSRE